MFLEVTPDRAFYAIQKMLTHVDVCEVKIDARD
jgi:hypothetical protein